MQVARERAGRVRRRIDAAKRQAVGNLLNGAESITVLTQMPWMWLSPGLMIVVLVICVNFIGDALRDAMDPTTIR